MSILVKCFHCSKQCGNNTQYPGHYITIEKNYTGEFVTFTDLCLKCFDYAADDILKSNLYKPFTADANCIYCQKQILNDMNETITGFSNATGGYCAINLIPTEPFFMHIACYEKNIGI